MAVSFVKLFQCQERKSTSLSRKVNACNAVVASNIDKDNVSRQFIAAKFITAPLKSDKDFICSHFNTSIHFAICYNVHNFADDEARESLEDLPVEDI